MTKWYRQKIGWINVLLICVLCGAVGFLSILSLASQEQADEWHRHYIRFFFTRIAVLMAVTTILIATLAALNIIYNLIYNLQSPRRWYAQVVPITLWCLLICLVLSIAGTLVLLS